MKKALLFLAVLMLVIVIGCKSSLEEAKAQYCNDLANFQAAIIALENVHANTTVDEAKRAQEDAVKAYEGLQKSAAELQDIKLDSAQSALNNLKNEVQNISGDTSLAGAAKMIGDAAEVTREEIRDLYGVTCP